MYIGGLMGCRGDAYKTTEFLPTTEAKEFHSWQANLFAQANVDFLYAGIMPTLPESTGMALAMEQTELPYIISFMVKETGRLLDGTTINDAFEKNDSRVERKPVCYLTNCIHPAVFYKALSWSFNQTSLVRQRFHGIQANTSALSPDGLDNSQELKSSDCLSLAQAMYELIKVMTLKIIGGCCGTDNTHIAQIASIFIPNRNFT